MSSSLRDPLIVATGRAASFDEEDPEEEVGGLIQDDGGFSDTDEISPASHDGDEDDDEGGAAVRDAPSRRRPGTYDDDTVPRGETKKPRASLTYTETTQFLKLVWPVALTCVVEFVPSVASIVIVGHYCDRNALDGAALGTMYFNVAALSIGLGLTTALDTLAPQAVGAGKDLLLGVYLQRGGFILCVVAIPIVGFAIYSDVILVALGQPEAIARRAGSYVRWMLPGLPFYWGFELLRKVFHAYGVVKPLVAIGIVSTVVHCFLAYVFVRGFVKLPFAPRAYDATGFVGAAFARSAETAFSLIALVAYANVSGLTSRFWGGFAPLRNVVLVRADVMIFLKLGGAGCAAICFEWWAFEVLALFAGLLPKRPDVFIGAHAVLFNLAATFYMFLSGCASAASVRTGLALGAARPDRAKIAARVALVVASSVGIMNAVVMYLSRDALPPLFDRDPAVRRAATVAMPALAAYQIFDAFNAAAGGVMRGAGRQATPAAIMLVAYYVVGLPAAACFAFALRWNLVGLWTGLTAGLIAASTQFVGSLLRLDYDALAQEAVQRSLDADTHRAAATDHDAHYLPLVDDSSRDDDDDGRPPGPRDAADADAVLFSAATQQPGDTDSLYSCRSSGVSLKPTRGYGDNDKPGGGDDDDDDCASQHTTDTALDSSDRWAATNGGARFAAVDEAGEDDIEDEVTM